MSTLVAGWGSDTLLIMAVALLAAVLLNSLAGDVDVDSWLALVTGRVVWQHGIPHRELLTVAAYGHPWIDQQWLSQLAYYALDRLGGLNLVGLANVGLLVGAVGGAVLAARRLGGPFRSVLVLLPVCLAVITPSREVRTQEFALPLFVCVCWLLAADSRAPSRRVLWCLPLLVLWANLHGTVTLGATLVVLRGLLLAWECRGSRAWRRPLALVAGAPLAALVTPYGLAIAGYYRATMASGTLRHFVTEWRPVWARPLTASVVFAVTGLALWSFRRRPSRTTAWEKLAFLLVAATTVEVVRNAVFFGLLALIVVPVALGWTSPGGGLAGTDHRRTVVNGLLVAGGALVAAIAVVVALARPQATTEYRIQRAGVLTAVRHAVAADPSVRVLSQEDFADWLLWRDPALTARVGYDVRFELYTPAQLDRIEAVFAASGAGWKDGARGYRLLVLNRRADPRSARAFLHEPGVRVLYDDGVRVVLLRSAAEARG